MAGRAIALGDATGDGLTDVLVSTPENARTGGALLVPGRVSGGAMQDAGWFFSGTDTIVRAGISVALGDVNGDGVADVGIGASGITDGQYLLLGPVTADASLADADIALVDEPSQYCGTGSDLGDLDGDGLADAVQSCPETHGDEFASGVVLVRYAPLPTGSVDMAASADARLSGEEAGDYTGDTVQAHADVNGDGLDDILVGAIHAGSDDAGAVYVVYGPPRGDLDLGDADGRLFGESELAYAGAAVGAGDVDADGFTDVLVGSTGAASTAEGAAYVVRGPAAGDVELGTADWIIRGESTNEVSGAAVAVEDIDGDGRAELLVGATGDSTYALNAGAAFLFFDLSPGAFVLSDADAAFYGGPIGDGAGAALAIGDVLGGPEPDLLIGAPGQGTGGGQAGGVYVVDGGG